jgi:hypothetical protein
MVVRLMTGVTIAVVMTGCVTHSGLKIKETPLTRDQRIELIRRATLWAPTDIHSLDLRLGPQERKSFLPEQTVRCSYVDKEMEGASPKFTCAITPEDEIKVKYGRYNAEVYGEVAATRLLWALGFGADRMYPVKVICRGCPTRLTSGMTAPDDEAHFDIATVERKFPGQEVFGEKQIGWQWNELNLVDDRIGGAPKEQRDALKLFAVMLQHTDSKPEQQRLSCLDEEKSRDRKEGKSERADELAQCAHPFMLVNDLGLTFARANEFNMQPLSGVNYDRWAATPVWKGSTGCEGNLKKSLTGTLSDPVISERGRVFLADLLTQLSDKQLHDVFEVARFNLRSHDPDGDPSGPTVAIDKWVAAFKDKRDQIVTRHCAA